MVIKVENLKISKAMQLLALLGAVLHGSWGLVIPFLAIFISAEFTDGSIETVGIAVGIFLMTKALLQFKVVRAIENGGNSYKILFIGVLVSAFSAFLFSMASEIWHIYLILFVAGIGTALLYPAWYDYFGKFTDKGKELFQRSLYDVTSLFTAALTAFVGGVLIVEYGYEMLFVLVGLSHLFAMLILVRLRDEG